MDEEQTADQARVVKYPLTPEQEARLDKDFTYHAPHGDQAERYGDIRRHAKWLARIIMETTPPSREQSLALTHLEEAVMFANAAIARNE